MTYYSNMILYILNLTRTQFLIKDIHKVNIYVYMGNFNKLYRLLIHK